MSAQFRQPFDGDSSPGPGRAPLLRLVEADFLRPDAASTAGVDADDDRTSPTSRILSTEAEFDALREPWAALHQRIRGTVFQSFEWQRTWWKHCGSGNGDRSLRIVVFSRGDDVVAIAPLMLETERVLGVVPVRILRFVATGVSDYLGVLCEPAEAGHIAAAFSRVLPELRADLVSLSDLTSAAEFCMRLTRVLKADRWIIDEVKAERCPRTCLQATWPETLATFPRSVRKRMTQKLKRVQNDFEVEYSVIQHAEEFDEVFSWLTAAHQTQWQKRGHGGVFKHPQEAAFLQDVARQLLPAGWLYLAQLKLNGRRIAVEYGFQVGDSLQVYQGAMDCPKEWERYSPGTVIHTLGMQAMIARGVRIYDFLRGTESYKYSLGATDETTWHLRFTRPDSRWVRWKTWLWRLQKTARTRVGDTLVALQSRLRDRASASGADEADGAG